MSLTTRTVYTPTGHGLAFPNGKPAADVEVRFTLVSVATGQIVSPFDAVTGDRISPVLSITTDANGEFSTPLWPNDRGANVATQYICHIENGQSDFKATIASSATPIAWLDFMLMGAPLTPLDVSRLDTHIADDTVHLTPSALTAGLFPKVNAAGTIIEYVAGPAPAGQVIVGFSYGDASPASLTTVSAGKRVFSAELVIETGFDGTGAALSIGSSGSPSGVMAASENDPAYPSTYQTNPAVAYGSSTPLLLYITPGAGATVGAGQVVLSIEP